MQQKNTTINNFLNMVKGPPKLIPLVSHDLLSVALSKIMMQQIRTTVYYDGLNSAYAQPPVRNQAIEEALNVGSELSISAEKAALWNQLPIFGYGSYQQGDTNAGNIMATLDGITWTSLLLGFSPLGHCTVFAFQY